MTKRGNGDKHTKAARQRLFVYPPNPQPHRTLSPGG
jgi:hypothetical protein